jgi:hypothetical protein
VVGDLVIDGSPEHVVCAQPPHAVGGGVEARMSLIGSTVKQASCRGCGRAAKRAALEGVALSIATRKRLSGCGGGGMERR